MLLPQLIANSLIAGAIYTLLAVSFSMAFRVTKFFNFAHGAIAAVGGYAVFFFLQAFATNAIIGIGVGILFAGVLGFLIEKCIYLPLRKRKSSNTVLLVASLGVFTIIEALLAILFSSQFQTLPSVFGLDATVEIFGAVLSGIQIVAIVASVLVTTGLVLFLRFTKFGKEIRAVSDSEEVSKIVGINTNALIGKVFLVSALIAGFAGMCAGFDTGIEPTMGLQLLLKGIIASIIGGLGSIYGGALGGFLLGFVENFGVWQFSGEWKDAIAFAVLILFLLLRPQGITKQ